MHAYIIKGSLGDYYLSDLIEGDFGGYPVWKDRADAKEFYTHSQADSYLNKLNITQCSIIKVRLTIRCRPGVIQ